MLKCQDCGKEACTTWGEFGNARLCWECRDKRRQAKIIEQSHALKDCTDFKNWDSGDMSELFWIHLGRYVKEPNPESLKYMEMAYRWACHDSHGLSNSFFNAMKWAKIDLYKEQERWRKNQ